MKFINILDLDNTKRMEVREWRNHDDIRKNMYSDTFISEDEHISWLTELKKNFTSRVYIAHHKNSTIGLASLNMIDYKNLSSHWAFYLNPNYLSQKGLGTLLEYHFLNYVFDNYPIEKLNCEVLDFNSSVIKMHQKFGFSIEGILRKNVIKNNQRVDVYCLGICKEEWATKKDSFTKIINRLES